MKRFLLIKKFVFQLPRQNKLTLILVIFWIIATAFSGQFGDDSGAAVLKFLMAFWATLFIIMCAALLCDDWHKWRKNNPQLTGS